MSTERVRGASRCPHTSWSRSSRVTNLPDLFRQVLQDLDFALAQVEVGAAAGRPAGAEIDDDIAQVQVVDRQITAPHHRPEDTMPKDDSGSVSPEETADIIAYLLQSNDAPAGESEIPPDREQVKGILVTRKPN
jgi:hypothetical protein